MSDRTIRESEATMKRRILATLTGIAMSAVLIIKMLPEIPKAAALQAKNRKTALQLRHRRNSGLLTLPLMPVRL